MQKVFYIETDKGYEVVATLEETPLTVGQYSNMRNIIEEALLMTGKRVKVYEYLSGDDFPYLLNKD